MYGILALAVLGTISLASFAYASHGFSCSIDCEPPTIWKTIHGSQLYGGLIIENQTFTIEKWRQEIPTTNATVGKPIDILLRMYENYGFRAINHVALFFDEEKSTSITWEKKYREEPTVRIDDPNEIIGEADVSIIYENDFIVKYNFTVSFVKPLEKSTIFAIYWDEFVNSNNNYFIDALRVQNP